MVLLMILMLENSALGANRVEGVNGKVNALHEGVCRIETREGVKGKE